MGYITAFMQAAKEVLGRGFEGSYTTSVNSYFAQNMERFAAKTGTFQEFLAFSDDAKRREFSIVKAASAYSSTTNSIRDCDDIILDERCLDEWLFHERRKSFYGNDGSALTRQRFRGGLLGIMERLDLELGSGREWVVSNPVEAQSIILLGESLTRTEESTQTLKEYVKNTPEEERLAKHMAAYGVGTQGMQDWYKEFDALSALELSDDYPRD